jgi:AcrR family transcriptional regulator
LVLSNDIPQDLGTREHILSVASQLFSERGFGSVSIRDICEKAGVTPPTIYYYFGNKDHLFQAVVRETLSLKDFQETLVEIVERQPDPRTKICAFIHHYLAAFPKEFFNPGMFLQSSTQVYDVSTERVKAEFQVMEGLARKVIREGIQLGAFRDIDVDKVTEYFLNLLLSFLLGEVHFYQSHNPDEAAPFIADLFLDGLYSRAESQSTPKIT